MFPSEIPSLSTLDSAIWCAHFSSFWWFLGLKNSLPWSSLFLLNEISLLVIWNNLELNTFVDGMYCTYKVGFGTCQLSPRVICFRHQLHTQRQRLDVWSPLSTCPPACPGGGGRQSTNNEWPSLAAEAEVGWHHSRSLPRLCEAVDTREAGGPSLT